MRVPSAAKRCHVPAGLPVINCPASSNWPFSCQRRQSPVLLPLPSNIPSCRRWPLRTVPDPGTDNHVVDKIAFSLQAAVLEIVPPVPLLPPATHHAFGSNDPTLEVALIKAIRLAPVIILLQGQPPCIDFAHSGRNKGSIAAPVTQHVRHTYTFASFDRSQQGLAYAPGRCGYGARRFLPSLPRHMKTPKPASGCSRPPATAHLTLLASWSKPGARDTWRRCQLVEPVDLEINWVAKSLEGLAPVTAGGFYVYGSHETAPVPPGLTGIRIDAAQAFAHRTS